jgi:uncharacterized CHY-type Zn-finger protein
MEKNNTANTVMIYGDLVDENTRCIHYNSSLDIIAIKFKCCKKYYPCYQCHNTAENHEPSIWPKNEFENLAILCGNCKTELSIATYLNGASQCPTCKAAFNPNCSLHHDLYFSK